MFSDGITVFESSLLIYKTTFIVCMTASETIGRKAQYCVKLVGCFINCNLNWVVNNKRIRFSPNGHSPVHPRSGNPEERDNGVTALAFFVKLQLYKNVHLPLSEEGAVASIHGSAP